MQTQGEIYSECRYRGLNTVIASYETVITLWIYRFFETLNFQSKPKNCKSYFFLNTIVASKYVYKF